VVSFRNVMSVCPSRRAPSRSGSCLTPRSCHCRDTAMNWIRTRAPRDQQQCWGGQQQQCPIQLLAWGCQSSTHLQELQQQWQPWLEEQQQQQEEEEQEGVQGRGWAACQGTGEWTQLTYKGWCREGKGCWGREGYHYYNTYW
jgi:hypothetical protein